MSERDAACAWIGERLQERGERLAVAESLTAGMVAQCFGAAPAASEWFQGGVVAYRKAVKFELLDVPDGPVVSETAALAMADGVRRVLGADIAAAVTGAGGPAPQDGQPPGTVWVAVAGHGVHAAEQHRFDGTPPEVCEQAATATVRLVAALLRGDLDAGRPPPSPAGAA